MGVGVEGVNNVADEALFSVLEAGVANKADTMISVEAEVGEAGGLVGKITINLSGTETLRSISNPSGRCWRRLISIGWQN